MEADLNIEKYETANSWYSAMHAKGYQVPITLCQAIEKLMKAEKVTFAEAFKRFEEKKRITCTEKVITFN